MTAGFARRRLSATTAYYGLREQFILFIILNMYTRFLSIYIYIYLNVTYELTDVAKRLREERSVASKACRTITGRETND